MSDAHSADWEQGFTEGIREAERSVPPLLRRFFWWDKEGLSFPKRPLYIRGADEYCNRTVGVRLWNGVLFIRIGRIVRLEPYPDCPDCAKG